MTPGLLLAAALAPSRPQILVHVMPWFEAPPISQGYGYHWTMNKEKPPATWAAHYKPVMGFYDSLDPVVVECQVALMKLGGMDGILADWYGPDDAFDYKMIHERTKLLFQTAEKAGLKVSVVWEDQTLKNRIQHGGMNPAEAGPAAERALTWVWENWAQKPSWIRLGGKPLLLVFGPQHLQDNGWPDQVRRFNLLTLHHRRGPAVGGFDWPLPSQGLGWLDKFEKESKQWPLRMASAYPRFHDYYDEAGVQKGHPDLPDDQGRTYRMTLERGLASGADAVQIATWNDWGEGTQIEPSEEHGLRDLAATQEIRRKKVEPGFRWKKEDLELVLEVYRLRKAKPSPRLDAISQLLLAGKTGEARSRLSQSPA